MHTATELSHELLPDVRCRCLHDLPWRVSRKHMLDTLLVVALWLFTCAGWLGF